MQRQTPNSVSTTVTVNDLFMELGKKTAQVSKLQEVLQRLVQENQVLRVQNETLMKGGVQAEAKRGGDGVRDISELALTEDVVEETKEG